MAAPVRSATDEVLSFWLCHGSNLSNPASRRRFTADLPWAELESTARPGAKLRFTTGTGQTWLALYVKRYLG